MFSLTITKSRRYKETFNTVNGKDVLKDLLEFCHYRKPTYVSGDPCGSAYNEGMRRVALRIVSFLNMSEADIQKIMETHE